MNTLISIDAIIRSRQKLLFQCGSLRNGAIYVRAHVSTLKYGNSLAHALPAMNEIFFGILNFVLPQGAAQAFLKVLSGFLSYMINNLQFKNLFNITFYSFILPSSSILVYGRRFLTLIIWGLCVRVHESLNLFEDC